MDSEQSGNIGKAEDNYHDAENLQKDVRYQYFAKNTEHATNETDAR